MPAHKPYENSGTTAMQRRWCCEGVRKQSCNTRKEEAVEESNEKTPVPAIPVLQIQAWKLPT